jgi:hypothetical protein
MNKTLQSGSVFDARSSRANVGSIMARRAASAAFGYYLTKDP